MSSEDRREPGGGLSGESLSSLRKLGYASRASCTRLDSYTIRLWAVQHTWYSGRRARE
jgi:hypothetical protein